MNPLKNTLILLAFAWSGAAKGEEIPISPEQVQNLGIRFETPRAVSDVVSAEATARVVVPPDGDALIGVPEAGLLTVLNVSVGDEVNQGDVLAETRSPAFIAMQRELLDALNTHRLSQSELARDIQLHREGIISARRLEETTTRSMIAETSLNEHRQLLKIAGLADADVRRLETAQVLLEALQLRAPFDGVIVERLATTGQRLDAMAPVYRLADLSELWLQIHVPQEQAEAIFPGMRVTAPDRHFSATITTIGKAVDPSTQSIIVRARVISGADRLRPGQFVAVELVTERTNPSSSATWAVPVSAVTRSGDDHVIFLGRPDGVEVRRVELVGVDGGTAYVGADLDAGHRVAVSGVTALKSMWFGQADEDS